MSQPNELHESRIAERPEHRIDKARVLGSGALACTGIVLAGMGIDQVIAGETLFGTVAALTGGASAVVFGGNAIQGLRRPVTEQPAPEA